MTMKAYYLKWILTFILKFRKGYYFQNTRLGDIWHAAAEAVEEDPSIVASKVTGADINADVHSANGDYEAHAYCRIYINQ
jgi:hypothetical protein